MSFATSSLGASLCFLVCFTSNACLSPLQLPMEPKNLIETIPLDVWHEILNHLNGYDKCLNYFSRIIALPVEAYDTIARELVITKEDLPLDDEIDSWITQYFSTTHYQPLRQSMGKALIRIIQVVPYGNRTDTMIEAMIKPLIRSLEYPPCPYILPATIHDLDSVKDAKFMIGLTRYWMKLLNQNIFTRLSNNMVGFFVMMALAILLVGESVQRVCWTISDTTFLCQLSLPLLFTLFVYGILVCTYNSQFESLMRGLHLNGLTAITLTKECIAGINAERARLEKLLERLVEKKESLILRDDWDKIKIFEL